ncbi:hypothetical protein [Poseidonocella sedimentorum]|uniref:Uncharacterized protein n=1 Tax=Poseidonocella sedimentorum TaxID=871652 RepID=A0A1I6E4K6_9RHOB|nr:hypothetical protein [Poseidonocella sedimentorum]SFR12577.1 hypothetical protein SAMN04515673_10784 [Poseidonocella sedimentorum]
MEETRAETLAATVAAPEAHRAGGLSAVIGAATCCGADLRRTPADGAPVDMIPRLAPNPAVGQRRSPLRHHWPGAAA